jgi:hypothetical protein
MNHYKELAEDYTVLVAKLGFKDSQNIAPLEYLNDVIFVSFLPLWVKDAPEFQRLQRIYK